MTAKLVKGENLTTAQVKEVKAAFGYRWTVENLQRAKLWFAHGNQTPPTMQPQTDAQWLKEHAFYITARGTLAQIPNHCEPVYMAE